MTGDHMSMETMKRTYLGWPVWKRIWFDVRGGFAWKVLGWAMHIPHHEDRMRMAIAEAIVGIAAKEGICITPELRRAVADEATSEQSVSDRRER